jgi:hypothetical protein
MLLPIINSAFGGRRCVKQRAALTIMHLVSKVQSFKIYKTTINASSFVEELNFVDPHRLEAKPQLIGCVSDSAFLPCFFTTPKKII